MKRRLTLPAVLIVAIAPVFAMTVGSAGCAFLVELDDGYVAGHGDASSSADAGPRADSPASNDAQAADGGDGGDGASPPLFQDDFDDSTLPQWILAGSPIPRVAGSVFGHATVFDNAGDPNFASGAVSRQGITCSANDGCTIAADVYMDFSSLDGCWATATIAFLDALVTDPVTFQETSLPDNADGSVLGMSINAVGDACTGHPQVARRHAWFGMGYRAADGSEESPAQFSILADDYVNKWVHLEVRLRGGGTAPLFVADGKTIYAGKKGPSASLFTPHNLALGSRSSGSAGKAYHDSVRVFAGAN